MSRSRKTTRSANVAPLYAAQPQRTPARRRAGALLMGTALSAIVGLGYGRGAYAQNVSPTGALSQSNNDTVAITGPGTFETQDGFSVDAASGDGITITTASGETGDTIFTDNNASTITGASDGIYADNNGSGALSITTTGTVTGTGDDGINADNSASGSNLTIDVRNVNGGDDGLDITQNANAALQIEVNGNVSAGDEAIHVDHNGDGLVDIDVTGNLVAEDVGIEVDRGGSGDVNINVLGNIRSANGKVDNDGINADHDGDGNLFVEIDGDIFAGDDGLEGSLDGVGNLTLISRGTIDAGTANFLSGSLITDNAIEATHRGIGTLTILTTGPIEGARGIEAEHTGDGALSITASGDVLGQGGTYGGGIYAKASGVGGANATDLNGNSLEGVSLAITANNVTGATYGIYADNDGSGALSITTTGTVTGTASDAIYANNSANGGALTVIANSVEAGDVGVRIVNNANNNQRIEIGGNVKADEEEGVYSEQEGNGDLVIITEGDVESDRQRAIRANHRANGNLRITASGNLTAPDDAIFADHGGDGDVYVEFTGNRIATEDDGIDADLDGVGSITVITRGTIEAGDYSDFFSGYGPFTDNGIKAIHNGIGDVNVLSTERVSGARGIAAEHNGDGAISITATGDVVGTGTPYGEGIYAKASGVGGANATDLEGNSLEGVSLAITANNVTGGTYGIYADNDGSGALSITTTGTVTGTVEDGIYANNSAAGTGLSITANNVTGNRYGIDARQYGSGDLVIDTTGGVVSAQNYGVSAFTKGEEVGGVDLNLGDVRSEYWGVYVGNRYSTAPVDIMVTGDITAAHSGIRIEPFKQGYADIRIQVAGDIQAAQYGMKVFSEGDLTIISEGRIEQSASGSGSSFYGGIYAFAGFDNAAAARDTYIYARDIEAGDVGISVYHYGAGSVEVRSVGSVTSDTSYGIRVRGRGANNGAETPNTITITANDVTGGTYGIYADNDGTGALSITANGAVTGGTEDGIYANNVSTEDLTITINEGGSVSTSGTDTANDFAIQAVANNGAVIVNNFGTVTGRVSLTNSNTFTNAGTWDLAGTTSDFNATGNSLVVNEGLIVAARDASTAETSVIDNLDTFRMNAGGTIRLTDGAAGDVFQIATNTSGTGNFVANGGTVALDVVLGGDGSAADQLGIRGDVILDGAPTALAINSVGGGTGGETTTGIEVVTVGGSSDAGAFVLAGPVEVGAIAYDLSLGDCTDQADENWYLCNNGTIGTTGAVFEAMPGVVLNTFARSETLQQRLGARVQGAGATGTLSTKGDADLPVAQAVGPWMRTWGDFAEITPDSSSAGTRWEADSWGLEAGIGTILGDHAGGNLVGGVNLRYSATYADLSNPVGTASLNSEGFGAAASLTWFGNDGFYVDGNAAVDFVSIDATSQGGGELLNDHDEVVYSASAEVGKRIELQGGTTLVPQAQLSWGKMRDGTLTDNLGNVVSFADRETLTSRVGLTVEQDVTGTAWGSGKVFGFGNVLHDLQGSRTTTVAGTDVTQSGTGDWLELGGGFSLQPTEGTNLFGQVSYREAFNGVDGDAIAVSAGWRMQW